MAGCSCQGLGRWAPPVMGRDSLCGSAQPAAARQPAGTHEPNVACNSACSLAPGSCRKRSACAATGTSAGGGMGVAQSGSWAPPAGLTRAARTALRGVAAAESCAQDQPERRRRAPRRPAAAAQASTRAARARPRRRACSDCPAATGTRPRPVQSSPCIMPGRAVVRHRIPRPRRSAPGFVTVPRRKQYREVFRPITNDPRPICCRRPLLQQRCTRLSSVVLL